MHNRIYNTTKAIIFDDDSVLLIRKEYEDGRTLYTLPGGSQNPGETLEDTLKREMYEETAAAVHIISLFKVYEHQQVSNSDPELTKHKVEFVFHCHIVGPYSATMGPHPDPHQTDVVWIKQQALTEINLYPAILKDILAQKILPPADTYIGDITQK